MAKTTRNARVEIEAQFAALVTLKARYDAHESESVLEAMYRLIDKLSEQDDLHGGSALTEPEREKLTELTAWAWPKGYFAQADAYPW